MDRTLPMWHLLWKDFHQVRPALVGCTVMLACIQVLVLAVQLFEQGSSLATFQQSYFIALVAPTLAAMACAGLLIGQERQNRTWNWSSSLPISWSAAMTSKLAVWLVASIAMTALLLLFYVLLYRVALLSGRTPSPLTAAEALETSSMLWMMLIIPLEVFVVFSMAALLWNDTLLAFVLAAVAVCFGNLVLIDLGGRALHGVPFNGIYRPQDHLLTSMGLPLAAVMLAALGLGYAFHWRWTSGQLASVSLGRLMRLPLRAHSDDASRVDWAGHARRPSGETAMMLIHAWRTSLGAKLTVVLAALALLGSAPATMQIQTPVSVLAALFLGVTVFGGEHPLGRYRFFADRGASWPRFLLTHTLVTLAWLCLLLAAGSWLLDARGLPVEIARSHLWILSLCAFGVAVFCSLCIANSIIATGLALVVLILCGLCYETAYRFWVSLTGEQGAVYAGLPFTVAAFVAGILVQTRRWLVLERPSSWGVLLAAGVIGLALPIWANLTFGYLTIPNVPWQGLTATHITSGDQARLPRFQTETPETATLGLSTYAPTVAIPIAQDALAESYRQHLLEIEHRHGSIQAWLDAWSEPLEEIEAEADASDAFVSADSQSLSEYTRLIEQTAIIGAAAVQVGDREHALAAWKLNRMLLDLGKQSPALASYSLPARVATWGLWNQLTDAQLAFLQDQVDIGSLLPGDVDQAVWALALRLRWTTRRLAVQAGTLPEWMPHAKTLKYYPPLRWPVERQMAQQLNQELELVASDRPLVPTDAGSVLTAHEPLAVQIELLRRFEQAVTAKVLRQ